MLSSQFSPAWAPDGRRFAFTNLHARWTGSLVSEIWEAWLDHSHARQLTLLDAFCDQPAWAPDGTAVAFSCDRPDQYELYRVSLPERRVDRLTHHPARDTDPVYAPDGRRLVFVSTRGGGEGLYLLPLAADGAPGDAIPLDPFPGEERPCQAPDWR
jgi:TolB protein